METSYLKCFREKMLKLKTQKEFAQRLGVELSVVKNWEENPDDIKVKDFAIITEKTGYQIEDIVNSKNIITEPLILDRTWDEVESSKQSLVNYIKSSLTKYDITDSARTEYIDNLAAIVKNITIKPKVALVGRSDTGKSTLINTLLGAEKMPTSWTPTTSIAVYIKHIDDRPEFITEDMWIFKNSVGGDTLWDERRLYDEKYCLDWKLASGNVEGLKNYGTRQGENFNEQNNQAGSAVLFIDSPILCNCDIIDLPGFGTQLNSDDEITFKTTMFADVIVYLCQANGFMRNEDSQYLVRNIKELPVWEHKGINELPPLSNLFILASQAHTVDKGNIDQLKNILDKGSQELLKTLPDRYWEKRKEDSGYTHKDYGKSELRDRFYTYTTDSIELSEAFNSSLKKTLENLPIIIKKRMSEEVKKYVESKSPKLEGELNEYNGILESREKYSVLLRQIKENEIKRVENNDSDDNQTVTIDGKSVTLPASGKGFDEILTKSAFVEKIDGTTEIKYASGSSGSIKQTLEIISPNAKGRQSWRQLR